MLWFRRRRRKQVESSTAAQGEDHSKAVPCISFSELQSATHNFSPEKKIEDGQFGELYQGELSDGTKLAVKKLAPKFHREDSVFASEVSTILAADHPNLVKLMGCCMEADHQFLLYESLEDSRPLSQLLFNPETECLSWQTRMNITMGVARGLVYLHEKAHVIHGDIQAGNIFVDTLFTPKITGFGLVKLLPDEDSYVNSRASGTLGYMAPEYALDGKLSERADVFSFGVVLLEVISGRNNLEPTFQGDTVFLVQWTWDLYQQGRVLELVDPRLNKDFPSSEVLRAIHIALLCTQASPKSRPSIFQVSAMLTGDWDISVFPSKPGSLSDYNAT